MNTFGYVTCPRCNGTGGDGDSDQDCLACRGDGFIPDPTKRTKETEGETEWEASTR